MNNSYYVPSLGIKGNAYTKPLLETFKLKTRPIQSAMVTNKHSNLAIKGKPAVFVSFQNKTQPNWNCRYDITGGL